MGTKVIAQINDYVAPGDKRCIKFYDAEEYNDTTVRRPLVVGELVLFGRTGVTGLLLIDGGNVFDSRGNMLQTLTYTTHPAIIREAANIAVAAFDA